MDIITLTINPAVDKSSSVDHVVPERKLRCEVPQFEPGGGGINVSRALKKLGADSLAVFFGGGSTGEMIESLLQKEKVTHRKIPINGNTRENLVVVDKSTGNQFRFGMPGPTVTKEEQNKALGIIKDLITSKTRFLVISGSLSPGMAEDYFASLIGSLKNPNLKVILDTSGTPLLKSIEQGVYMIKPNLRELSQIAGLETITCEDQHKIAGDIIQQGKAQVVVTSLGARGALLTTKDICHHIVPPTVHLKSTVGAGDSMVAGILYGLNVGMDILDAVRYGVASGTAATMNPGTALCNKEDVENIYHWITSPVHTT